MPYRSSTTMITINGKTYVGNNVIIRNGNIIIDGENQTPDTKNINISINGDISSLIVDDCNEIKIEGNVNTLSSKNGTIDIKGNVTGDINSKNGTVMCGNVGGSVESKNGNINYRG